MIVRTSLKTSPLSASHELNKGVPPIYVYDSDPIGGRHYNQIAVAESVFRAAPRHRIGPSGMAYAIPTRSISGDPHAIGDLKSMVRDFCSFAKENPHRSFQVTKIGGCRSAAHVSEIEIATTFLENDPGNLHFPGSWVRLRDQRARRICIVSPVPALAEPDIEAVKWLLRSQDDVEIVVPGVPLQHRPGIQVASSVSARAVLFSADPPAIGGKAKNLIEELVWYSDFAIVIKPRDIKALEKAERARARRLDIFYRCALENKIGVRSLIAGVGIRPAG